MKDFEFGCTNCGGPVRLRYAKPEAKDGAFVCSLDAVCATPPCRQVMFLVDAHRVAPGSYHGKLMMDAEENEP